MYGFTKSDMSRGIEAVGAIPSDVAKSILDIWESDFDGFRFHPEVLPGLFNPNQAMYNFQQLRESAQKKRALAGLSAEQQARKLLQFLPDVNTFPAESTLRVIAKHPLGASTIRKALTSNSLTMTSPVMTRFRLSAVNELATDADALLSFMFYTGIFHLLLGLLSSF